MFVRGREVKFRLVGSGVFKPPNIYWFALSGVLIVISLVALLISGINLGIEFEGGYLLHVRLENPADVREVRDILGRYADLGLDKSIVQTGETEEGYALILRMPYLEDTQLRGETIDAIKAQLQELYGFKDKDGDQGIIEEEEVGSEWGREVSQKALIALGVFVVIILIFISLRLEFKMGVAAIVSLVHDILITVGIYALSGREVTPVTVIAFLTILGYSLYDTIVVFDRVKENTNLMGRTGKVAFSDIVNESVNQTLLRSIGTTLTTLLPIVTILIFGGDTLKDFAFALLLGVFLGAYSSVFVASPVLAIWKQREPRYAALRERAESGRGAREAILISRPGGEQAGVAKKKARRGAEVAGAAEEEKDTAMASSKQAPATQAKPKPASSQASAAKTKPKAAAGTVGAPKKKAATTKGPSGGKKKKKKKK